MGSFQQFFGEGFDTESVPPAEDFVALPPGKYIVGIDKAEVKTTKAGNGHYLEVVETVLDGPCKNRKLWDRINIDNPNQQCVEIGLRSLAALGLAIGLTRISASEQLIGQVCVAHVRVKDEQNDIRTYSKVENFPISGTCAPALPPPVQASGPLTTVPSPNVVVKPPWSR